MIRSLSSGFAAVPSKSDRTDASDVTTSRDIPFAAGFHCRSNRLCNASTLGTNSFFSRCWLLLLLLLLLLPAAPFIGEGERDADALCAADMAPMNASACCVMMALMASSSALLSAAATSSISGWFSVAN
jgi:hypothetical protein